MNAKFPRLKYAGSKNLPFLTKRFDNFFISRQMLEKLKSEKDQEIFNLREQSQRLQVQLNNGHVGFSDFKEKKSKEVQELKNTIEAFSLKV